MTNIDNSVPPVVCTLTTKARAEQVLEWSDLAALALTSTPLDNGVASTYPLVLADQIEDLAVRELDCCGSWLSIEHRRATDAFHLQLTTQNPEGIEIIAAFHRSARAGVRRTR